MKRWRKALGAILCILPVACLAAGGLSGTAVVKASGLTNDLIKEKEQEIESARNSSSRILRM